MKAIVYTEYGSPDVLKLQEVAQPTPKANEVLVRVHAAPVNFGDLIARHFNEVKFSEFWMPWPLWLPARLAFGFNKPRKPILGNEFAGEIAAVGKDVRRFKVGDPVFGYRGESMGTYAEYVCMRENGLVETKPANMNYDEAAAVPGGAIIALRLLKKVAIRPGQKVLINGASGGIGAYLVQLAKHFGAEVTGVCGTARVAMVKSLGAHTVIDYTQEDFTTNGVTYDLIFDILGKRPFSQCKGSLQPDGRCVYISFRMRQVGQMLLTSISGGKKVICALITPKRDDLAEVKQLVEAGKIKAAIDRRFPLEQTADAHRYIEAGQRTGSVIITVQ